MKDRVAPRLQPTHAESDGVVSMAHPRLPEKLLPPKVAFEIIGVSDPQGYSLIRQGILPAVKVGRQYRIDPETLREWIRNGGQSYEGGWRKQAAAN